MRVLITGGLGFIGSYLVDLLTGTGQDIEIVDVPHALPPSGWKPPSATSLNAADVRDLGSLERLVQDAAPDCVVHLAAVTGVKRCAEFSRESFEVNVYGTYNIAMAACSVGSKLILASSREVYGETLGAPTSEDAPRLPNNLYGLTKFLAEEIVEWAHAKYGLRYTILRLTNVYGPRGEKYGFPTIVRKALRGEPIELMGGRQVMNFLFVEDAVRAIAKCISDPRSDNRAFNVGSACNISLSQLLVKIGEVVGRPLRVVRAPTRPGETLLFTPDIARIRETLRWSAEVSIEEGIKRLIESYEQRNA